MSGMVDARELLAVAERLARAGGAVLRARPADLGVQSKSTPTDVVTVVDREAERVILDELARLRPGDRVVAEESGESSGGDAGVTWYVDPLDGTVNYTYALAPYAVSVAAVVDGEAVAGAVLDVPRDELFLAARGAGATRNGDPIGCSATTDLNLALVSTGFAYDARLRTAQAGVVARVLPVVRDIRRHGSAAVDLVSVACGRVDAHYEAGTHVWDWAAGALIAREAGARVEGLRGQGPGADMVLAANPTLFGPLHDLLLTAGAGDRAPVS
jgi:myo-inositol-1(or 4)-monophosphatase